LAVLLAFARCAPAAEDVALAGPVVALGTVPSDVAFGTVSSDADAVVVSDDVLRVAVTFATVASPARPGALPFQQRGGQSLADPDRSADHPATSAARVAPMAPGDAPHALLPVMPLG
jgi:hypothetical protein